MRRVGILGGTFDPVHNAHLELAHAALRQYALEFVLFVPAANPAHKLAQTRASAQDRLAMLEEACAGIPGFCVSGLELLRDGVSYTVDTLRELTHLFGDSTELYLIVGEDMATDLSNWKDAHHIAKLAHILFAKRPAANTHKTLELPAGFSCQEIALEISSLSSSVIRELLASGEDVSSLVPAGALAYIKKYGLYAQSF